MQYDFRRLVVTVSCVRPLACWDYGFESRREHRYLSLVSVVCCQVEVSALGCSLVQRFPTECGVSECDRETSTMGSPWATRGCCVMEGEGLVYHTVWTNNYNVQQFYVLPTRYVYVFCVELRTNSDSFPIQR